VSFEFEHPSRPIEDNVRAVAKAEFDRAIAEITETGFEVHETVRSVRRRLKRVRSIIRLIRPAFHDHVRENRHLRDMGAEVSALRDAAALVEAVDLLSKRANGAGEALPALRERLAGRAAAEEMKLDREAFLLGLRGRLREARVRSELWDLNADGAGAVVPGFVKTYTKARAGFRLAHRVPTREHLHEWRKAVKFHWAQLGLLRRFAPEFAEARRAQAKKLAETLGDHHNLCVLEAALVGDERKVVAGLIETELERLGKRALKLGRPLFAETPDAVERRWRATFADREAVRRLARRR
jgi:hypothetical protein